MIGAFVMLGGILAFVALITTLDRIARRQDHGKH